MATDSIETVPNLWTHSQKNVWIHVHTHIFRTFWNILKLDLNVRIPTALLAAFGGGMSHRKFSGPRHGSLDFLLRNAAASTVGR